MAHYSFPILLVATPCWDEIPEWIQLEGERTKRKDIVLHSLHSFISRNEIPDRKRMSQCLGIRKQTLDRYTREMVKEGLLKTVKNEKQRIESYKLTRSGFKESKRIEEIVSSTFLDPESSCFSKRIPIKMVLDQFRDSYEMMEFMDQYFFRKEKEASRIFEMIKAMRPDSRFSRYIREVLSIEGDKDERFLEDILKSSSIYSVSCDGKVKESLPDQDLDQMILRAEVLRRMGSINDAKWIYNGLLRRKKGLEPNRWLLCFSGSVQCMVYENKTDEALEQLDRIFHSIKNPVEKAFLKKNKADIVQDLERYQEASELYKSCLGIFQEKKYPVIRASILNNLGVLYFRKDERKVATKLWGEAFRIVKRIGLKWSICMTSINLADAYSLQGNTKKALRLLGEARTFLRAVGDLEGLSEVDFNMALVQIERGDKKRALMYYERAEEFPFLYKSKIMERRKILEGRMRSKKW